MFEINGIKWKIEFVQPWNDVLMRSDGSKTVGVTDMVESTIYLSKSLRGAFLRRVMAHELCHAFAISYNIHMPLEEEERLADWIATYGTELVYLLDDLMGTLKKAYIA